MTVAVLLTRKVPAGATFWLDHGRRQHRLIRNGADVVAEHRDGRAFRAPWPEDEPIPAGEAFAACIFGIASKTKAADPAADDLR